MKTITNLLKLVGYITIYIGATVGTVAVSAYEWGCKMFVKGKETYKKRRRKVKWLEAD